jgi:K+ transporter
MRADNNGEGGIMAWGCDILCKYSFIYSLVIRYDAKEYQSY